MQFIPHRSDRHRAYKLAYQDWIAGLPESDRRRLRHLGLLNPEPEQFGRIQPDQPAVRNQGQWQPAAPAVEPDPEAQLGSAFSAALSWCCEAADVVQMGKRLLAVMQLWRPSLVAGMQSQIDPTLIAEFQATTKTNPEADAASLAPVLEWLRRGTSLSGIGQRFLAMVYVIRPQAIRAGTLAEIGALTRNKTRQAVDKLVQDFRDTFGGITNRSMRPEKNRTICQRAQLRRR